MTRFLSTLLALTVATLPVHAQDSLKPVKLLTVTPETASIERTFFGKVVARQTVDLAFQVGGQVVELPAVEGEITPEGEMVAQLDLESFILALEEAQLRQDQAKRVVDRYQKLQGSSVTEVSLEDAVTQAALADVAVRNAQKNLEDATLLAPYDALVAERMIANFTTIGAGTAVVRLHDMSEVRIEIDVPEVLFQRAGNDPDITVTASFPSSDRIFPLELREFRAETSSVGQTFRLTFGMPPPEGLAILPGSSVTVSARLNDEDAGLSVPTTALIPGQDGGLTAMVFEPDIEDTGTVRRVPVTTEPMASGRMRILDGLDPGTEIVGMGASALEDGQRVRRFQGFGQ